MVTKHGFDLTDFVLVTEAPARLNFEIVDKEAGAQIFAEILEELDLPKDAKFEPIYEGSSCNGFVFENEKLKIVTGNNPITGQYNRGDNFRERELGYAGYIGLEGEKEAVKKAVTLIKKRASMIKDESPGRRDFI